MMSTRLPADICELIPVELVTTRVRMPDLRLIALLTTSTPLTVQRCVYVETVEAATGAAEQRAERLVR